MVCPEISAMLESLPHLPAVVAVQLVLNPPIIHLGLSDASCQVSSVCTVLLPNSKPESRVSVSVSL